MDPNTAVNPEMIRQLVVDALNIGRLTPAEQDKVMNDLGAVLIKRATYAVLKELSQEDFDRIDKLADQEKDQEMAEAIQKSVPNAQTIMEEAIKSGVEEYKKLVNEEVAKRTAPAPAAAI